MNFAQISDFEKGRLASLEVFNLFNTPPEERFDKITNLTANFFKVPVAGFALVGRDIVWYKSILGFQFKQIERQNSFSTHTIDFDEGLFIDDAVANTAFFSNPLVTDGPKIRFYAGISIKAEDGSKIGAFFIADRVVRKISEVEAGILKDLASWVELELHKGDKKAVSRITEKNYKKTLDELTIKNRELEVGRVRQKAMLESIGDGVIEINDKGEIAFVNKQAEIMLDWKQENLVGKILTHTIKLVDDTGNEVPINKRPIRDAMFLRKRVTGRDYSYVRKDGSKFSAAITATPIAIYNQVVGGVNVFRDITKEKDIDRMKTEFISLASHQLRTPLSAMKWFAEMLIDEDAGQLNDEQKEMVNNIYQSNERMIELVNALLNISRIESGRIIIEPVPTDLKNLVEEVVGELRPKLDEKCHKLAISVHENIPKINIDPKLVRHVYMNLLTNAIKYTPKGGEIAVIISKSGNEVISQITDNGRGIPKNQEDRVFQKFFRGQNIVKVVTDGTGLGLYLTKAIVDSSGGKIWFESEEGRGTTFWFILPLSGSRVKEGEVALDS